MHGKLRKKVAVTLIFLLVMSSSPFARSQLGDSLTPTVRELERQTGGRLGVSVTDLASGATWGHRENERFPIASTFKAFVCAHLLALADAKKIDVAYRVRVEIGELDSYSPITKDHIGGEGMSLFELCDAATAMSDNTAANLILRNTGGPEGLTRYMRTLGDLVTRLDRYEPALNNVGAGEIRDTTSPHAAATSLGKLLTEDALQGSSRSQLKSWLIANKVGGPLLRASLPNDWTIADRTGASDYGSRGVLAVIWPKACDSQFAGPLAVAVYLTDTSLSLHERNEVIATVGRAIVRDVQR